MLKRPWPDKRELLNAEVGVHAALMHQQLDMDNLVRWLGVDTYEGRPCLVLEYMAGGSLRDRLERPGQGLPHEEVVAVARGILSGLAVIHGAGVIHRDIKPENILFDGETPKLADFGISRPLARGEVACTRIGTLHYVPPEVIDGPGATFASDLWSFGVTLYEMACGRLPFGDRMAPQGPVTDRIRRGDWHPFAAESPPLPAVRAVVARALTPDPAGRFASAAEMAHVLDGTELLATHSIERAIEDARRRPDAEARLRALAAAHPREPRVCQALGEVYSRAQRPREAERQLRRARELAPDDAIVLWGLAVASEAVGKRAQAAACLQRALEIGIPSPAARRRAEAMLAAWDPNAPVRTARPRRQATGCTAALGEIRALSWAVEGLDSIERRIRAVVERYPADARGHRQLGECYSLQQRFDEAVTAFRRAAELADSAGTQWSLTMAYEQLGNLKRARICLARARRLGLDPKLDRYAQVLAETWRTQDRD